MKAVSDMKLYRAIRRLLTKISDLGDRVYTKGEVDVKLAFAKNEVNANHYTKDEVDEKFSNISTGGSAGMNREFHEHIDTTGRSLFIFNGRKSKIYVLTFIDNTSTGQVGTPFPRYTTVTIDFKGIHVALDQVKPHFRYPYIRPNGECTYFEILVSGFETTGNISFELSGPATSYNGADALSFSDICGYY